jgi:hypothetical protein
MDDVRPTQSELLDAWRDAARAAQLTERLAAGAIKVADEAESDASASEEIADLAEGVSRDAGLAATKARQAATKARRLATERRQESNGDGQPL